MLAPKPSFTCPAHAVHGSLERILRENPADANGYDLSENIKTTNHGDELCHANMPPWPAAMVAPRSRGPGAP